MTPKNRITLVLSLCLLLFLSISCQRTSKTQQNPQLETSNDTDSNLSTSSSGNPDVNKWFIPMITEYLLDDDLESVLPIPPVVTKDVAINERLTLPLSYYDSSTLQVNYSSGYHIVIVEINNNEVVFDLLRNESINLTVEDAKVNVTFSTSNGQIVAQAQYTISSLFSGSEIIVNLKGVTATQFQTALNQTDFSLIRFVGSDDFALVNIGSFSTEKALKEMESLLNGLATSSTVLQTQSSDVGNSLASPNYAYKPNGRSVRSFDPTCTIIPELQTYVNEGSWNQINNLATITQADEAHTQGFDGTGIVIALLDSGVGEDDSYDCLNTPEKEAHGTYIKSIIEQIAPGAEVISKNIFNPSLADNTITSSKIIEAMVEIENEHLKLGKKVIMNMSFSGPEHPNFGHDLMLWRQLTDFNVTYGNQLLIVSSAGNQGFDEVHKDKYFFPASFGRPLVIDSGSFAGTYAPFDNLMSVGSVGIKGTDIHTAEYNPTHNGIDVLAYGVNLCSNANCVGGGLGLVGSSFSTPIASAIAALNWQQCSTSTPYELLTQLKANAIGVIGSSLKAISANNPNGCGDENLPVWTSQFGSWEDDTVFAIANDGDGNTYAVGETKVEEYNGWSGSANGINAAFLVKHDANGSLLWNKILETPSLTWWNGSTFEEVFYYFVYAFDVKLDQDGNVYVVGQIRPSSNYYGPPDIVLVKYNSDGQEIWMKTLSSDAINQTGDHAKTIFIDDIREVFYVVGYTGGSLPNNIKAQPLDIAQQDAFIAQYDLDGNVIWIRQFGSGSSEQALDIQVNSVGDIYVSVWYLSSGPPNYIVKYDFLGNQLTTIDVSSKKIDSISIDSGDNILVVSENQVNKIDGNGNQIWSEQLPVTSIVQNNPKATSRKAVLDDENNIYIFGTTQTGNGNDDPLIVKTDENGNQLWLKQFGSGNSDKITALSLDDENNLFVAGHTDGFLLGNINQGKQDVFVAKIVE